MQDGTSQKPPSGITSAALSAGMNHASKYSAENIQNVLVLLVREAPFLVHQKVKDALHTISAEQHLLYQTDSILKALGIEDSEDLEELVSLFLKFVCFFFFFFAAYLCICVVLFSFLFHFFVYVCTRVCFVFFSKQTFVM